MSVSLSTMQSVIGYSWQTQNCIKQNIRCWPMVYIKLSISIWQSPKKATFFCKPSGNIANHGNMFIVFKCHTRSLIRVLYGGIYQRVFQHVCTHFPNTFHSFIKPSWISQTSTFRWSCGVHNPQGQTHSIKIRSLALSLCCFLSSSLAMKAGNSSNNTQIFTACPELRCLLLPYQLPLDFGTKLDTSNHSRRSMIFMSKQQGFFCAYSGWNSSYSKMVCGSCTYLHSRSLGEGAGLHGACHSQVLMLPEHSVACPKTEGQEERGLD